MLTFLRKLRRSLIASGSARKYLLYAVGEVALVVIGILIALQINNWNEDRKSKNRLLSHYAELKEEINYDLRQIEEIIQSLEKIDGQGMYMRSFLNQEFTIRDTTRLKKAFLEAGYYVAFDASRMAYDNLVNSGDINMITNKKLTRLLGEFHNQGGWDKSVIAGYVRQTIEEYHHYRHTLTEPLMDRTYFTNSVMAADYPQHFDSTRVTLNDFSIDWKQVLSDDHYSVILDKLHTARLNQKMLYYKLKDDMISMIDILDIELNPE